MTIACLAVPSLALACSVLEHPRLRGQPVALTDDAGLRVADATSEAALRGVRPGMTLREAVAFCPRLTVLEPRPARILRMAEQVVEAVAAVSPLFEAAEEPGIVFADLRGLEGLYPQRGQLEQAMLAGVTAALQPRLGVAEERFTALAAARSAEPGGWLRIEPGESREFLADKPAGWLPLDAEALARLRLFGTDTVGDYAALPHHAVQAQFGRRGAGAWLAARGLDPEPVHPRPPTQGRVVEHLQAEPPLVSRESLQRGAEQLLRGALRHPLAAGRLVRLLRLRAVTEDDQVWERAQTLREPTNDRARLWTVVRSQIEYAEFPGPVTELELEVGGLTAETGRQPGLFLDYARRRDQLDDMVRHLKVRFGQSPVAQVVEVEPWSRLPERRYALMHYDP